MSQDVESVTLKLGELLKPSDSNGQPAVQLVINQQKDEEPLKQDFEKHAVNATEESITEEELARFTSPVESTVSFEDMEIPPDLLEGLYNLKFFKPTAIQGMALPPLLNNPSRNVIVQAQSGSGKTGVFLVAMLARIEANLRKPQALCLVPTRELAIQIMSVAKQMNVKTNFTMQLLVKDDKTPPRRTDAQLIIGTPGTVSLYLRKRLLSLTEIKMIVLDEADEMMHSEGLCTTSNQIKQHVVGARRNKGLQIALFSATMPPEDTQSTTAGARAKAEESRKHIEKVLQFCRHFAPNAHRLVLKRDDVDNMDINDVVNRDIIQCYMDCDKNRNKLDIIGDLVNIIVLSSCVIFCKTKNTVKDIHKILLSNGIEKIGMISSDLSPEERDEVMDRFKKKEFNVIISTNLLARGIDVDSISLVVNYDLPTLPSGEPDYDSYIHRIGRTGRYGRKGASISFVQDEESWACLERITRWQGKNFEMQRLPSDASEMEAALEALNLTSTGKL